MSELDWIDDFLPSTDGIRLKELKEQISEKNWVTIHGHPVNIGGGGGGGKGGGGGGTTGFKPGSKPSSKLKPGDTVAFGEHHVQAAPSNNPILHPHGEIVGHSTGSPRSGDNQVFDVRTPDGKVHPNTTSWGLQHLVPNGEAGGSGTPGFKPGSKPSSKLKTGDRAAFGEHHVQASPSSNPILHAHGEIVGHSPGSPKSGDNQVFDMRTPDGKVHSNITSWGLQHIVPNS